MCAAGCQGASPPPGWLDGIACVASSCGQDRGHITPRVASCEEHTVGRTRGRGADDILQSDHETRGAAAGGWPAARQWARLPPLGLLSLGPSPSPRSRAPLARPGSLDWVRRCGPLCMHSPWRHVCSWLPLRRHAYWRAGGSRSAVVSRGTRRPRRGARLSRRSALERRGETPRLRSM